ncbi:MAG: phytanoyl-CoA dioxygenase family protein [Holophagaceae bacterium]|nr:phytanoyl-CoA dioxygenase family protein [Holophagaceae bacterium]
MSLTDAQKTAFATDGFLVVRGLITPEEASGLVEEYDGLASGRIRHATWNGRDGEAGALGMRQIPFPSLVLEAWQDHAYRRRALEAARELLGDDLDYFFDQLFMKPPHCPAEVPWHQDAAYWGEVGAGVTCWLALSEVTEQHGCMEFVRGSHLGGLLPHGKAPLDDQYAANPEMARNHLSLEGAPAGEVVRAPLGPGDATFHHYKTLHRSRGNAAASPRRGLATHFTLPSPRLARHMARLADYARSLGVPAPG